MPASLRKRKSETITEKPAFKESFQRRRTIIPVDGVYEWMQTSYGKQPMRVVMKKRNIFSLAGIYDTWVGPEGKVSSFSIVTTACNSVFSPINDRMPVIIHPDDNPSANEKGLDPELLRSLPIMTSETTKKRYLAPFVSNFTLLIKAKTGIDPK